jgi:hypothetical protein
MNIMFISWIVCWGYLLIVLLATICTASYSSVAVEQVLRRKLLVLPLRSSSITTLACFPEGVAITKKYSRRNYNKQHDPNCRSFKTNHNNRFRMSVPTEQTCGSNVAGWGSPTESNVGQRNSVLLVLKMTSNTNDSNEEPTSTNPSTNNNNSNFWTNQKQLVDTFKNEELTLKT